jgi:hypothetical protein
MGAVRKCSDLVILSEVGAHATAQPKDPENAGQRLCCIKAFYLKSITHFVSPQTQSRVSHNPHDIEPIAIGAE